MVKSFFYKTLIVFSALFFFVTGSLFSQSDAQELIIGSSIEGSLGYGEEIWYRIRAGQTSFLTIETTGETDTYLEIYDSQNIIIMQDDDGGERVNARVDFYVRSGANYFIKLRGYNNTIAGQYYIKANYMPMPTATELTIGTPYTGRLSAGEDHWFSVRNNRSGIIVVETSGNTDTYLDVYNNSYTYVLSNDDGGEGKNARIEIPVNANQTYYFKLRPYSRNASGSYRIVARFEQYVAQPVIDDTSVESLPPDTEKNTDRSRSVSVDMEEEKQVIFYGGLNESRWYSYEIKDEESNLIIRTTGNLNTFLYLYDSLGNQLTRDDNSGEGYNALISKTLEPGIYYIEIMEFFNRAGRCSLHIEVK
jgi:hypothetical protein